jgi:hypothetical protein
MKQTRILFTTIGKPIRILYMRCTHLRTAHIVYMYCGVWTSTHRIFDIV